jgi:phosphoribosylformylglycinamidine cyclo-ligase
VSDAYKAAGVDVAAADALVERIADPVTATWGAGVVGGFGGFAAGLRIPDGYRDPVLMLSTDGVGTKLDLARRSGRWDGVGHDLVAMCVDDLAAVGAAPIGFVDYLAVGALDPARDEAIVRSVAEACETAGCALVGGETAEHPGVVDRDHVDLAGTALGVVEQADVLGPDRVRDGDLVLGIESPNLRSNGFSLVRKIMADRGLGLDDPFPDGSGRSVAEVVTEPSVIYSPAAIDAASGGGVKAFCHVTGGGLPGNLPRVLPEGLGAEIDTDTWERPSVFRTLVELAGLTAADAYGTFNMGLGFLAVVDPVAEGEVSAAFAEHGHRPAVVGQVRSGFDGLALL